jgi:hypothetical protein
MHARPSGHVALLTDFGERGPAAGLLRAAVLRGHGKAVVFDLGHTVPPHDVDDGAFWLWSAIGRVPNGTAVVAGVGDLAAVTRWLVVAAHQAFWLGPDNGVLSHVFAGDPEVEVRSIDVANLNLRPAGGDGASTVLAPVAAWLGGGRYGFSALGPRVADPVRLPPLFEGATRVVHVDGHGNLVTNVRAEASLEALQAGGRRVDRRSAIALVPGELVAQVGSHGLWEIAQPGGHAARALGVARGAPVVVHP